MAETSQGSANGTVDHSWNSAFCYKLEVLYKLFRLLLKCYCFYTCVYVLFYNQCATSRVPRECHVVMQAH